MKPEQNLTTEESLVIITSMINQAKGNVVDNSVYFIMWGLVIMAANIGMAVLMMAQYQHPYIVWIVAIPAWLYTIYQSWTQSKKAMISTHLDRITAALWLAFGVIVFTFIPFGKMINFQLNPLILLVSAIPTFVSGIIIHFRPLVVGGVSFWILGIVCFLVQGPWQFIVGALAVLIGFLIPGIILRNKRKLVNV